MAVTNEMLSALRDLLAGAGLITQEDLERVADRLGELEAVVADLEAAIRKE